MKIAITGSDGMLGSDVVNAFSGHDVVPLTINDFNITDLDASAACLKSIKPRLLIHVAAYTDVDGCETDPEKAYHVNGIGTRNLAMTCEEIGCEILYISTDYVFDGQKCEPYNEWDIPGPVNKYGMSKLMGEQYVASLTNRFYIVRTSWLFGKKGKNFVDTICRLINEKDEINVVDDQIGIPTYTADLASALKCIVGRGYGTYHITNSTHCSWYEFAREIVRLKSSKTKVKPISSEKYNRPAPRPSFSVLGNTVLKLTCNLELRSWKEALKDYLHNKG